MLNSSVSQSKSQQRLPGITITTTLLIGGIILGSLIGHFSQSAGSWLGQCSDYTLITLVSLLFFGVRFSALLHALSNLRFLAIALVANFVLIPIIGYGLAHLFLQDHPLVMIGLMIYFMSPCTDWFLGFTRLSGGNVALGMTLLPINMITQLLLYPFYLQIFTHNTVDVDISIVSQTLAHWYLAPLIIAIALHQGLRLWLPRSRFESILARADQLIPWVISLLVLQIFAGNIAVILQHRAVFAWLLLAVFVFFVITFLLGEGISQLSRQSYPEHALLTMTTAARNAPLMLAVTMAALPNQPLVYAALVIGMLIEFPHLTALRRILLSLRQHMLPAQTSAQGKQTASIHYQSSGHS